MFEIVILSVNARAGWLRAQIFSNGASQFGRPRTFDDWP